MHAERKNSASNSSLYPRSWGKRMAALNNQFVRRRRIARQTKKKKKNRSELRLTPQQQLWGDKKIDKNVWSSFFLILDSLAPATL